MITPATFEKLSHRIGHPFQQLDLLQQALTHRSFSANNNERLEFLGDAILSFIIGLELFQRFPKATEGELTRMRAQLVRAETLHLLAQDLKLGECLNLGLGELKSGGTRRASILADAFEALIGALYLDAGLDLVRERLLGWYSSHFDGLKPEGYKKDAKTRLQELLQKRGLDLPRYTIKQLSGEAHEQRFQVACECQLVDTPVLAWGDSRRRAEQNAADLILEQVAS